MLIVPLDYLLGTFLPQWYVDITHIASILPVHLITKGDYTPSDFRQKLLCVYVCGTAWGIMLLQWFLKVDSLSYILLVPITVVISAVNHYILHTRFSELCSATW